MDRGAWQATVHGIAEVKTWLSDEYTYKMNKHAVRINMQVY